MRALRQERFAEAQANARLRQIGAEFDRRHNGKLVYRAPRYGQWITVERDGAGYVLRYYSGCPCNS